MPDLVRFSTTRQAAMLATCLTARGCQVQTLVLQGARRGELSAGSGESANILGRGWPCDPRPFLRLRRAVQSFTPEVVHFWRCGQSLLSPVALACPSHIRRCVTP